MKPSHLALAWSNTRSRLPQLWHFADCAYAGPAVGFVFALRCGLEVAPSPSAFRIVEPVGFVAREDRRQTCSECALASARSGRDLAAWVQSQADELNETLLAFCAELRVQRDPTPVCRVFSDWYEERGDHFCAALFRSRGALWTAADLSILLARSQHDYERALNLDRPLVWT